MEGRIDVRWVERKEQGASAEMSTCLTHIPVPTHLGETPDRARADLQIDLLTEGRGPPTAGYDGGISLAASTDSDCTTATNSQHPTIPI